MIIRPRRVDRGADAAAERRQTPTGRAEDEAHVAVRDRMPHRPSASRPPFLEQAMRYLPRIEPEGRHVQKEGPGAGGPDDRQPGELAQGLVPAPLPLGVGGGEVTGQLAERRARADLGEPTGDEPVVDLGARTSVTRAPGATTHPTRQAIIRCSNEGAPTVTVRSRMSGSAAGCRTGRSSKSTPSKPPQ